MYSLSKKGLLIVLSGPSGVGKGTVCSFLRQHCPNLLYSISATTRAARKGEVNGVNYYFLSKEDFLQRREQGEFLEWAEVYGNFYGTPRAAVEKSLSIGNDLILEIDIQGARQVKSVFPEGVFIFLLPPSKAELKKRIQGRATDSEEVIAKRLSCVDQELTSIMNYDYVVINDQVEKAAAQINAIITAEKCRVPRNLNVLKNQ